MEEFYDLFDLIDIFSFPRHTFSKRHRIILTQPYEPTDGRQFELKWSVDLDWKSESVNSLAYKIDLLYFKRQIQRHKAENDAVTTILEIWRHRKALPNDAYPLAPYEDVLKVIRRLHPDSSPYLFSRELSRGDELAAALFDRLTRLILSLLFLRLQNITKKPLNTAAVESMGNEEKEIIRAINEWSSIFSPKPNKSNRTRKTTSKSDQHAFDFKENSIKLMDDIEIVLTELRAKLS